MQNIKVWIKTENRQSEFWKGISSNGLILIYFKTTDTILKLNVRVLNVYGLFFHILIKKGEYRMLNNVKKKENFLNI